MKLLSPGYKLKHLARQRAPPANFARSRGGNRGSAELPRELIKHVDKRDRWKPVAEGANGHSSYESRNQALRQLPGLLTEPLHSLRCAITARRALSPRPFP